MLSVPRPSEISAGLDSNIVMNGEWVGLYRSPLGVLSASYVWHHIISTAE